MYIKRVELTHFKSFGGTTSVPLRPGFTVISGPNGSGKSNILDALLFALGLSSSKGMRAERLPDLVNQTQSSRGRSTVEASVTVTFDLSDGQTTDELVNELIDLDGQEAGDFERPTPPSPPTEWSVTRKLRVTQQGTYTSNYYINEQACTLTELHEQLHQLRVYPEGYNVVLQGDVTSIISMHPRERREIIDELAGVGAFDRKITQAKEKLNAVKEREEKFRIVEKELTTQLDRLAQDRVKAEKYQRLKAELQTKTQWEAVLIWQAQVRQAQQLRTQIEAGDRTRTELSHQLTQLSQTIQATTAELDRCNAKVKALGEDELLALQATLATREAELRQIQRQEQDLSTASRETVEQIAHSQQEIQEQNQQLQRLLQESQAETQGITALREARDQAQQELNHRRDAASTIAADSEAWVQEQTALRHRVEALLKTLEPQRTEQARLQERVEQLRRKIQEQTEAARIVAQDVADRQTQYTQVIGSLSESLQRVNDAQTALAVAEQELQIQQDTQTRLIQEQRDKQRQLDKLEAQAQAIQETQGTGVVEILHRSRLSGICGLIAQLGRVDSQYQLALEIAAGARLSYLVVEDDRVAAAGIQILKQQRGGRATFLPLTKIRAPQISQIPVWNRPDGFVDYAFNLIDCDDRYREIFAYVFSNTAVFDSLTAARREMGQYRIVTLEGELLETSGAMTGGSLSTRQGTLHFGTVEPGESAEALALRDRLQEIDRILVRCQQAIGEAASQVKERSQSLVKAQQQHREVQIQAEQIQNQIVGSTAQEGQLRTQLSQYMQEFSSAQQRLQDLEQSLPAQETELQRQRQKLSDLEQSQTHSEWQQIQATIRVQEAELGDRQLALQAAEQHLRDLNNQQQRLQEKIEQWQQRLQEYRVQQTQQLNQASILSAQHVALSEQIAQVQAALARMEQTLASEKQERDRAERQLREQQTAQQQLEWQQQKLLETQRTHRQELGVLEEQIKAQQDELPDPLPDIPSETQDLGALQHELRSLQKRLQAMEPVNMLALEEYARTQARLEELSEKLGTLDQERTELLLRIENFTTLRQRAFKEAFDVVNQNFQTIFAELSDGDGYLQLDDPQDPFGSGLNLVAHPKGKPVRRLASMSGGEKSLTALSFIFALQRYRPSPFYAFDEVDMFLDGANVERLARMIRHQAQQAQFIVVSLRRPMIESAERTIGVTQARGAYTQVLGISLQPQSASVGS